MTASEILNVITTVAITQIVIDLTSRWLVYSKDPYKKAVSNLERAQQRLHKLTGSLDTPQKQEKQAKKRTRLEEDVSDAASDIARRHAIPGFVGSLVFLILFRVLSTEYSGQVIGILPFTPPRLLRKLTLRGLDIVAPVKEESEYNVNQACSFLFLYILCTLSVKYFVNKAVGVAPPKGADGGLTTVLDSPSNKKMLRSLGVDPDIMKAE